jgi:23S rRNA-/tRNA-specific pseudouridylate synthase
MAYRGCALEDEELLVSTNPRARACTVHGDRRTTLEIAVCHYLGGDVSPHPVSRLERGTSGIMAFAKSAISTNGLGGSLHTDAYARVYSASQSARRSAAQRDRTAVGWRKDRPTARGPAGWAAREDGV